LPDGFPTNQKPFASLSSPGGEETGEGERQNKIHSGSHPSQNEFRKRVPVRLHLISVIAKLRAPSRRDPLPLRNAEL
jgi:hypothetical protein